MKLLGLFTASMLFFFGCASTDLPPVNHSETFSFEEDEKRIWEDSRRERDLLEKSGALFEDPELEDYLHSVAEKLHSRAVMEKMPFRFKVLEDSSLNAFAFPDGAVYVHTGMLAALENEAQLAVLLAHETTHCTHRHGVRDRRSLKNTTAVFAALQTTAGPLGVIGDATYLLGQIGAVAAVTGYSRDLETEADIVGFGLVAQAGYDLGESTRVFELLLEESKTQGTSAPFFFSTHPKLAERIENYRELLESEDRPSSGGRKDERLYLEKIRRALLANARLDLKKGRLQAVGKQIDKFLFVDENNAEAYCIQGEMFKQKNEPDKALETFLKSAAIDPESAEAHKGAGLIYLKRQDAAKAKYHLGRYLELAPEAPDRKFVEAYLDRLDDSHGTNALERGE